MSVGTWMLRGAGALALAAATAWGAAAQDVVITNARILDGAGGVIEGGTLTIADGRIVSVEAGVVDTSGEGVIDADGRTVMPGFIEAHRHLISGDPDAWLENESAGAMQAFLDAGFTTVLSAIDPLDQMFELRRRIEAGETVGPRLMISGMVPLNLAPLPPGGDPARNDPARIPLDEREPAPQFPVDQARAMVRDYAERGVDNIKSIMVITPERGEVETLTAIVEEAEAAGVRSIVHTTSVTDMLAALDAGAHVLVHTPHIGWLDETDGAERAAEAGVPVMSTLGVFTPFFDENHEALFRDNGPFAWNTLHSAGQGAVNARTLWNAGVVVGYGTDTRFAPRDTLRHELDALDVVFSNAEMVTILTRNAAIAAGVEEDTGTLEPGKAADVVMLNADPLEEITAVLDVALVLKDGVIVTDNR